MKINNSIKRKKANADVLKWLVLAKRHTKGTCQAQLNKYARLNLNQYLDYHYKTYIFKSIYYSQCQNYF